jgi:hypothetical protein
MISMELFSGSGLEPVEMAARPAIEVRTASKGAGAGPGAFRRTLAEAEKAPREPSAAGTVKKRLPEAADAAPENIVAPPDAHGGGESAEGTEGSRTGSLTAAPAEAGPDPDPTAGPQAAGGPGRGPDHPTADAADRAAGILQKPDAPDPDPRRPTDVALSRLEALIAGAGGSPGADRPDAGGEPEELPVEPPKTLPLGHKVAEMARLLAEAKRAPGSGMPAPQAAPVESAPVSPESAAETGDGPEKGEDAPARPGSASPFTGFKAAAGPAAGPSAPEPATPPPQGRLHPEAAAPEAGGRAATAEPGRREAAPEGQSQERPAPAPEAPPEPAARPASRASGIPAAVPKEGLILAESTRPGDGGGQEQGPSRHSGGEPLPGSLPASGEEAAAAGDPDPAPRFDAALREVRSPSAAENPAAKPAGPAESGHAKEPAGAARGGLFDQIVQRAAVHLKDGQNEMRIDLKPEHLGQVRLQVVTDNQQVSVRIVTELAVVRDLIEAQLGQLKSDLQQHGLQVDRLEVSVAADQRQAPGRQLRDGKNKGGAAGRPGSFDPAAGAEAAAIAAYGPRAHGRSGIDMFI